MWFFQIYVGWKNININSIYVEILEINEEVIIIEGKKLIRYSMQLSMLKQLLNLKLINELEYELIQKKLMKDYGVVSNITAWL